MPPEGELGLFVSEGGICLEDSGPDSQSFMLGKWEASTWGGYRGIRVLRGQPCPGKGVKEHSEENLRAQGLLLIKE